MNKRRQPVTRAWAQQVWDVMTIQNAKLAGPIPGVAKRFQRDMCDLEQFTAGKVVVIEAQSGSSFPVDFRADKLCASESVLHHCELQGVLSLTDAHLDSVFLRNV